MLAFPPGTSEFYLGVAETRFDNSVQKAHAEWGGWIELEEDLLLPDHTGELVVVTDTLVLSGLGVHAEIHDPMAYDIANQHPNHNPSVHSKRILDTATDTHLSVTTHFVDLPPEGGQFVRDSRTTGYEMTILDRWVGDLRAHQDLLRIGDGRLYAPLDPAHAARRIASFTRTLRMAAAFLDAAKHEDVRIKGSNKPERETVSV